MKRNIRFEKYKFKCFEDSLIARNLIYLAFISQVFLWVFFIIKIVENQNYSFVAFVVVMVIIAFSILWFHILSFRITVLSDKLTITRFFVLNKTYSLKNFKLTFDFQHTFRSYKIKLYLENYKTIYKNGRKFVSDKKITIYYASRNFSDFLHKRGFNVNEILLFSKKKSK